MGIHIDARWRLWLSRGGQTIHDPFEFPTPFQAAAIIIARAPLGPPSLVLAA